MAEAVGADVAERIDSVEGDLATWTPERGRYDLVACLYVHVAGSVEEMVRRMAAGVAPGGTLFLVATARSTRPLERQQPRPNSKPRNSRDVRNGSRVACAA